MKKIAALIALAFAPILSWFCDPAVADESPRGPIIAPALSGITIDGDLSDWPADLDTHDLGYRGSDSLVIAQEDFAAHFKIGYSPQENLFYIGLEVQDDSLVVVESEYGYIYDSVEIYMDGDHSGGIMGQPEADGLGEQMTFQQYRGYAAQGSFDGEGSTNPYLQYWRSNSKREINRTRTQMAYSISGDKITYEWAVEAFDRSLGEPSQLMPGKTIGFDIAAIDRDDPENDSANIRLLWTSEEGPKHHDANLLGDVVLGESDRATGILTGTLRDEQGTPIADKTITARRAAALPANTRTDSDGSYRLVLAAGDYQLQLRSGQGYESVAVQAAVESDNKTTANLHTSTVTLPEILEATAKAYAALDHYADSLRVAVTADSSISSSQHLAWIRDEALRFTGGKNDETQDALHSDGDSLTHYRGSLDRFTVKDHATPLAIFNTNDLGLPGLRLGHQLAMSAAPRDKFAFGLVSARVLDVKKDHTTVELLQSPVLGNLVSGVDSVEPIALVLQIDNDNHLIRRATYEAPLSQMPRYWAYGEIGATGRFSEEYTVLKASLTAADLAFVAPQGADRVEWFGQPDSWVGETAPDFALTDYDGNEIALADYRGKAVLLNFWGVWCPPCVKEMPSFVELHKTYRDQGFAIVAISYKDTAEKVRNFVAKHHIEFATPLADADNAILRTYKITNFPTSFLIDKQGEIRYAKVGIPQDMPAFKALIEKLIADDGTAMLEGAAH